MNGSYRRAGTDDRIFSLKIYDQRILHPDMGRSQPDRALSQYMGLIPFLVFRHSCGVHGNQSFLLVV